MLLLVSPCSGPSVTTATASPAFPSSFVGAPPVAGPAPPLWACWSLSHGCTGLFCG